MQSKSSAWVIIVIVLVLIAGAAWYFLTQKGAPTRQNDLFQNPGSAMPEMNPMEKTNPFEGGYTNPFSE